MIMMEKVSIRICQSNNLKNWKSTESIIFILELGRKWKKRENLSKESYLALVLSDLFPYIFLPSIYIRLFQFIS